jgi:hypothetical protein
VTGQARNPCAPTFVAWLQSDPTPVSPICKALQRKLQASPRPGTGSPSSRAHAARADPGGAADADEGQDQRTECKRERSGTQANGAAAAMEGAAGGEGPGRPLSMYQALDDAERTAALLQSRLLDAVRSAAAAQRQADESEAAAAAAARRAERREAAAREAGRVRVAQLEEALQRLSARGDAVRGGCGPHGLALVCTH